MDLYTTNKQAKVNEKLTCPVCGKTFTKIQWQQAFCCDTCKNKYWNSKGDRHKDKDYYSKYNKKHPERLERIGIYIQDTKINDTCNNKEKICIFKYWTI